MKLPPAQCSLFSPTPATHRVCLECGASTSAAVCSCGEPAPQIQAKPHHRAKCHRAGCAHVFTSHDATGCHDASGFCLCDAFLSAPEKPHRDATPSETAYREAYERGIRRASSMPFVCLSKKLGSLLGVVAHTHAPTLQGASVLAWIEEQAFAFRKATDAAPQYWSAWQPFAFARWMGMGGEKMKAPKAQGSQLQPLGKRRT